MRDLRMRNPRGFFGFMLLIVFALVPSIALCGSSAVRDLPDYYTADSTFVVIVYINPITNAEGLALTETLPSGWSIVSSDPPYSKYVASTNSYKWLAYGTPPISPFTVRYTVKVPPGTTGTYQITGLLHTSIDDVGVTGDSSISDHQSIESKELPFSYGWNLICLPLEPKTQFTAQGFLDLLNTYGAQAIEIDRWYNSTWQGYIDGYPFNNFTLEIGKGYFVKCTSSATVTISGIPVTGVSVSFLSGWNLIGIPCGSYNAEGVLEKIRSQSGDAIEIDRWYNSTWQGYIYGFPFNNFKVDSWRGYFIKSNKASTCEF